MLASIFTAQPAPFRLNRWQVCRGRGMPTDNSMDKKTGKLVGLPQKMTPAQDRLAIKDFAAFHKMEHRILFLTDKEYVRASEAYGRGSVPNYYVIDKKGDIRYFQAGNSDKTAEVIGQVVDKLLKED